MNSRNKLIAVCVICAAVALLSVGGVVFAYQKYASTFNNASNGNVSLNSINEGMSYTILDDGTNVYENPDKGSAVLMQTKANETVSFLALAHGGFYKIRVNGVDGYVLCDKVVDTTLATLAPTENPTKVMYIVNVNESVTLRKTPDQNGEQITTIPLGTQVEFVKKENDDFSKITQLIRRWINENDFQDQNSVETSSQWVIDGVTHYFDIEYRKIFAKKGEYIGFFLNFIDTTEKRLAFEKEKFLATHDALTGLYNQSYFATKVSEALQQTPDVDWLLLCSNIKDFKLINDLFGLEKGNEVLKMEADLLKKYCGKNAVYGRIGGDKFAVCIPKDQFLEQKIMQVIQDMGQTFNNNMYHMHIYIGVYEITDRDEDVSIMCDKANIAIKTLRDNYDRSIAYYSDTILDKTIKEKQLVGDFDEAIEQKQFCMYLQPQMTSDGKMIGAEALVRWQHPKRGLIFPGDFIEIFERTGLIYRLDRFIWELAVQQLAKWQKEGRDELYISVNISTKDFQYMDVYQTITSLVERYGIIPSTLKLEITETAIMMGNAGELETIGRFRNYGFEVEIDDFGSGYSSLNALKDIDVDVLKIDMGFLRTTRSERLERSMSILNMIISLSKVLGLSVVTEGVETKEQVSRLSQMGCGVYQGYYFSKPIPVHEFEERYM